MNPESRILNSSSHVSWNFKCRNSKFSNHDLDILNPKNMIPQINSHEILNLWFLKHSVVDFQNLNTWTECFRNHRFRISWQLILGNIILGFRMSRSGLGNSECLDYHLWFSGLGFRVFGITDLISNRNLGILNFQIPTLTFWILKLWYPKSTVMKS